MLRRRRVLCEAFAKTSQTEVSMHGRIADEGRLFPARAAVAVAGLVVAISGYTVAGFILFVGSMVPLPPRAAMRTLRGDDEGRAR